MSKTKLLVKAREAADALSVCEKTLYSITAPRGDLRPTKIGRAVRYSVVELQRWIEARQRQQPTDAQVFAMIDAGGKDTAT